MQKFAHYYLAITLGFTIFGVALIGIWTFYPYHVINIDNSEKIEVDKAIYNSGDRITYTFSYCKDFTIVAIVNRAIVDGFRLTYDSVQSDLEVGCHTVSVNDLIIPDFLPSGIYHIEDTAEYPVNPMRKILAHFRTVDFEVQNRIEKKDLIQDEDFIKK